MGQTAESQLFRSRRMMAAWELANVVNSKLNVRHLVVAVGKFSDFPNNWLFVASLGVMSGGPPVTRSFVLTANEIRYVFSGSTTSVCDNSGVPGVQFPSRVICRLFAPSSFSETSTARWFF